jgi:hypothetical protein
MAGAVRGKSYGAEWQCTWREGGCFEDSGHTGVDYFVPALRPQRSGADAHERLPMVLRVQGLPDAVEAEVWRLLCVLLLWNGEMSAGSDRGRVLFLKEHWAKGLKSEPMPAEARP